MKNAEWMMKNGMEFSKLWWQHTNGRDIVFYETKETESFSTLKELYSEPSGNSKSVILRWLDMEHKEQANILNNAERRYLSAVIGLFRDKVTYICKADFVNHNYPEGYEVQHIVIGLDDDSPEVALPLFKAGTRYKNMETGKVYTLEELGL